MTKNDPVVRIYNAANSKVTAVEIDSHVYELRNPVSLDDFEVIEEAARALTTVESFFVLNSGNKTSMPSIADNQPSNKHINFPKSVLSAVPEYVSSKTHPWYTQAEYDAVLNAIPKSPVSLSRARDLIVGKVAFHKVRMILALLDQQGKIEYKISGLRNHTVRRI